MAKGDAVQGLASVDAGAFLDLQPPAGVEWIIHNIVHEDAVELYFSDGTNNVKVDFDSAGGGWLGYALHCTNAKYWRVKNTAAAAKLIGYDGIQSK